jgi:hypothetical protein
MIVARHEVPGSAPPKNSRPAGYGVIRAGGRADSMIFATVSIKASDEQSFSRELQETRAKLCADL